MFGYFVEELLKTACIFKVITVIKGSYIVIGKLSVGVDAIVSQSRECTLMILQSKQIVQLYAP